VALQTSADVIGPAPAARPVLVQSIGWAGSKSVMAGGVAADEDAVVVVAGRAVVGAAELQPASDSAAARLMPAT
jgi:hypothetical protein